MKDHGNDHEDSTSDYHAICLRREARRRGIETGYVTRPYMEGYSDPVRWLALTVEGRRYYFSAGWLVEEERQSRGRLGRPINGDATSLTRNKSRLKAHLAGRGFRVPAGQLFGSAELPQALQAFDRFSGPVCVKPNQGSYGNHVIPRIGDRRDYEAAVRRVAAESGRILVEESVSGSLIRFFFVRPDIVAVKLSRPASVVGDGSSRIAGLIGAKNLLRQKRAVPGHKPIVVDNDVHRFLALGGRDLDTVPAAGERVFLRGTSNGATGADSIATPGLVHPSYLALVADACNAVPDLTVSAADVMIRDPATPAGKGDYWILEMNRNPGLTPYHFPWRGVEQDVSGAILDFLARPVLEPDKPA